MQSPIIRGLAAVVAAVLLCAACGGGPDMFEQVGANPDAIPAYEVVDGESGDSDGITRQQATLIVRDATVDSVTAALADWASRSDAQYLQAVVQNADAATCVCSLRVARDERTAELLMGGAGPVVLTCTEPVR